MPSNTFDYDAIIALGSNIGDKVHNIADAIARLSRDPDRVEVIKISENYQTPPWGITDQDWFVNACISVKTTLPPIELLRFCLETEEQMGRRRAQKWGPRLIDLDVLVYRDEALETDELVLPHPHITERAFVLVPMADVAPDHLLKGKTITQWLKEIDHREVTPVGETAR